MAETEPDQRERELKFDVPDGWDLPDPAKLVPAGGSVDRQVVQLVSTYFDTARRDLLRQRLTLRRRVGDIDSGWQLKVPDGDARTEIRSPLGGRGIPEPLRTATVGVRGRAPLRAIARVATERQLHRVLDADGTVLAEIAVDSVTGTEVGEVAVIRTWSEVEVELKDGDEKLLQRAARWLAKRGATPSGSGSKLARTLGADSRSSRDCTTLVGLVRAYLDEQHEAIVRGDIELRRRHDVIHPTRVASRRYRSALKALAPLFDADRAAALDGELRWYAQALGNVRDRQVLRNHLDDALAGLPVELMLGPVTARLHQTLDKELAEAWAELDKVLGSRRYFDLLADLAAWRAELPVAGDDAAAEAIADALAAAERKVRRRLAKAPDGDGRAEALHRARKAAKRARYVAELAEPALGKKAVAAAKRAQKVQSRLGTHQDGVVATDFLRRVGAAAGSTPGENGFTFGLLYQRELDRLSRSAP